MRLLLIPLVTALDSVAANTGSVLPDRHDRFSMSAHYRPLYVGASIHLWPAV
jgi:hypothetical protein